MLLLSLKHLVFSSKTWLGKLIRGADAIYQEKQFGMRERILYWESGNLKHSPGSVPNVHVMLDGLLLSGLGAEHFYHHPDLHGTVLKNESGVNSGFAYQKSGQLVSDGHDLIVLVYASNGLSW